MGEATGLPQLGLFACFISVGYTGSQAHLRNHFGLWELVMTFAVINDIR